MVWEDSAHLSPRSIKNKHFSNHIIGSGLGWLVYGSLRGLAFSGVVITGNHRNLLKTIDRDCCLTAADRRQKITNFNTNDLPAATEAGPPTQQSAPTD
jgi:hypothetical protein